MARRARAAMLAVLLAALPALGGCLLPGPSLYQEGQQEELQRRLAGTLVQVIRKGDMVILRMPSDVTFAVDRAEIARSFHPVLDIMAEVIAKDPDGHVQVTGHADATGTEAHNQGLSERRAAAVSAYLTGKGVGRARVAVEGLGENAPIASNETEEGRAMNRRVEVVLQARKAPAQTRQ